MRCALRAVVESASCARVVAFCSYVETLSCPFDSESESQTSHKRAQPRDPRDAALPRRGGGARGLSPGLDNSTGNSTATRQLLDSYSTAT